MPAKPQLSMISDGNGVDAVRQLKRAPAAVAVSERRRNRLPTIGHLFTTPSVR